MRKIRDEYIYKFYDKVRRICYEFVRFYANKCVIRWKR